MWSLFKKKECDSEDGLGTGLFDYSGEALKPLKFSNGKTQESVVKEVLDLIDAGNKIIFIKGVCGTGKSAIALNLAKHFDKTSIVVPIKSLQNQYENDYMKDMFILKDDKNKLKISVIKGRNNFRCPFSAGEKCDDPELPCTIELRDKNTDQILQYIGMNDKCDKADFSSVSDVKRMNIATACPYWSPLLPSEVNSKFIDDAKKIKYKSVSGKEFALFHRKRGCGYYDQYTSYSDSDVLIFNSMKYLIELAMGRKPKTDLDIIDECDEFLDRFATEKKINMSRLVAALNSLVPEKQEDRSVIKDLIYLVNDVLFEPHDEEIHELGNTNVLKLIEEVLANPYLAENEDGNYYNSVVEIAMSFQNLIKETYVSFESVRPSKQKGLFESYNKDENVFVNLVSINLAQKFKEIIDANNVLVLMSGTLHSDEVLKDVFGLEDFKVVEAETELPGVIERYRTGLEKNCKYANFKDGSLTRKAYLKAFDVCMANATEPVLVHVSAFKDLPTEEEQREYKFDNLITQEKIKEMQSRGNAVVEEFTNKEIDVLFTTRCSRGVDFAGDKCNSIVLTRFPYPNVQGLFWKILKKEQPDKFMEFYMDKARRDLIQKVMRGVRFKGDKVILLSPDVRVFNARFE